MSKPPTREDRTGKDRRDEDVGPPYGLEDRRRIPERRLPEVEHVDFDAHIEVPPVVPKRVPPKDKKASGFSDL
jgi:hypothetical protein